VELLDEKLNLYNHNLFHPYIKLENFLYKKRSVFHPILPFHTSCFWYHIIIELIGNRISLIEIKNDIQRTWKIIRPNGLSSTLTSLNWKRNLFLTDNNNEHCTIQETFWSSHNIRWKSNYIYKNTKLFTIRKEKLN
jgi:hypothetical protein